MAKIRSKNGQYEKAPKITDTERTEDQSRNGKYSSVTVDRQLTGYEGNTYGSFLPAIGGSWGNPMGFPGYADARFCGTYQLYRWILQLPPVRFVRSIRSGGIIASTSEAVPSRKGVSAAVVEGVQEMINRLRPALMHDFFLRGTDYGSAAGEIIWEISEKQYKIDRVKPLLIDDVEYLTDKHGNFKGVEIDGVTIRAPFKAFKYTYDGEAGDHYGRSWLENIRATAVKDWLDCLQQLQRLGSKISGVVTIVMAPAGEFPGKDAQGNATTFTYKQAAKSFIEGLARGAAGGYMPNITIGADSRGGMDMLQFLKAVYGKSLVNVEVKDFSGNAAAIEPVLNRMKHAEELIFNGGLRSSRTGLEAQHGTKEEAGTHTDTGTVNAEVEDEDFARQLTPLVDAYLVANYGTSMKGAVHIHAPSLVDRKSAVLKAMLMSLLNLPEFALEYAKSIGGAGFTVLNKTLDIPQQNVLNTEKLVLTKQAPPAKPGNPEPQGGRPKQNAPQSVKVKVKRKKAA